MVKDGGPAYPRPFSSDTEVGTETMRHQAHDRWMQDGMSLRDHYAGLAMQAMLHVEAGTLGIAPTATALAAKSYEVADAMLAEKQRQSPDRQQERGPAS